MCESAFSEQTGVIGYTLEKWRINSNSNSNQKAEGGGQPEAHVSPRSERDALHFKSI